MLAVLDACNAPVIASFVLAGGVLTGKYDADPDAGRAAGSLHDPSVVAAATAGRQLAELARAFDTTPATLAVVFTLTNPNVASVLFGATTPEQVAQNTAALAFADQLDDVQLAQLKAIGERTT